jgi:hypothetical protein
LKVLAIALSIIALIGSSLACGQSDTQAAQRHDLDRVVPRLPNSLSIEEVEERLGEPRRQYEAEGEEIVLNYRLWEVVFRPSLYKKTRLYLAGYWPADRPFAPLDREVRALKLGSSRRIVERDIGKTEAWEILTLGSNERLWYGNGRWKLVFKDRRLSGRVLYR